MGNQTSRSGGASGVESLVGELPGVVYKRPLGGGRFFKTSQCVHDEGGPVVVKTYIKRSSSDDVRKYEEALLQVQSKLRGETMCCHVWVVQKVYQSEDAVHIVRQYMWASLAERITTRPFLNGGDKRWIGYQIVLGLCEIHGSGICHGDIKTENVLLTSWGWVFLVDFAPYKPVYLPMDNPADFSFFFDTNGRRKCCLAPERFVQGRHLVGASAVSGNTAGMMHVDASSKGKKQPAGRSDNELTMEMDIFAAGCVLAELFSDGKSVLDYSELLVYKRTGELPKGFYESIKESSVEKLVKWMMEIDPSKRPAGEECLDYYTKNVLKCSPFDTHVHPIVEKILYEKPENRAQVLLQEIGTVWGQGDENTMPILYSSSSKYDYAQNNNNNNNRENVGGTGCVLQASKGVYELDQVEEFGRELVQQARAAVTGSNSNNEYSNKHIMNANSDILLVANDREEGDDEQHGVNVTRVSQSLVQESDGHKMQDVYDVLVTVQCALIRGCEQNRAKAELLHHVETCLKLSDNAGIVMNHVVPHFVAAASDAHSGFRPKSVALSALPRLLDLAESVPACNARLYADYVFPSISLLPNDIDVGIQVTYSHTVGKLGVQAYTNATSQNSQTRRQVPLVRSIDEETARIRHWIGRGVHDILVGTSPAPKLALLPQLQDISFGLGRKDTAEELLPALLTLFNSREWDVRSGLYLALKSITPVLGPKTAPFVLPFLDRMLHDPEPMSVVSSLELLECLVSSNLLQQREILSVVQKVVASNIHTRPCTAIRILFAVFISSVSNKLGPMTLEAVLCPLISSCFQQRPTRLTDPVAVVRNLVRAEKQLQSKEELEGKRFHADYSANSLDSYLFSISGGFDGSQRYTKSNLSNVIFSAQSARDRVFKHAKREERTNAEVLLKFSKYKSKKAANIKDSAGADIETVGRKLYEWKPQGILVSRIPCHSRPISKVASLEKSTLFVTASLDGTMKLWDTKRMERDVSFKPRATYCMAEQRELTSVTALRHQASTFIGGSCRGSLHAWDASTSKLCSTWDLGPGKILDVESLSANSNLLLAASQSKGIVGVDVRCPDPLWQLETKASQGIPFRLGLDQNSSSFIVAGTNRGYLTLWDLRFGLPVNSWMHPSGAPVECVAIASPSLVGNSVRSPLVFCAAGEDEISGWDPTSGTCKLVISQRAEVSETCPPFSLCHSLIDPTKPAMDPLGMARQLGAAELRSLSSKRTGIKSFLLEPSGGVISGGNDRMIRYWKNPSESYAIAFAHPKDASSPPYKSTSYAMKRIKGVNVLVEHKKMASEQEASLSSAGTELVCHQQPITSLAQVCGQNAFLLVSASADGVINVWR